MKSKYDPCVTSGPRVTPSRHVGARADTRGAATCTRAIKPEIFAFFFINSRNKKFKKISVFLDHNMNLHKMIEICLKDDNMHRFVMINALNCINIYVITCINSMLLAHRARPRGRRPLDHAGPRGRPCGAPRGRRGR